MDFKIINLSILMAITIAGMVFGYNSEKNQLRNWIEKGGIAVLITAAIAIVEMIIITAIWR